MWFHSGMRPLYVRRLNENELKTLTQSLKSPSAFTLRRSQILLKSHEWQKPAEIAAALHCSDQTVRLAIHAFHEEGLACLQEKSHAAHSQKPHLDQDGEKRLAELIRLSPRTYGHETSVWTRELLAQQLNKEGHTERVLSTTSISNSLKRMKISWRRAKKWLRSPDPHYEQRKKNETS